MGNEASHHSWERAEERPSRSRPTAHRMSDVSVKNEGGRRSSSVGGRRSRSRSSPRAKSESGYSSHSFVERSRSSSRKGSLVNGEVGKKPEIGSRYWDASSKGDLTSANPPRKSSDEVRKSRGKTRDGKRKRRRSSSSPSSTSGSDSAMDDRKTKKNKKKKSRDDKSRRKMHKKNKKKSKKLKKDKREKKKNKKKSKKLKKVKPEKKSRTKLSSPCRNGSISIAGSKHERKITFTVTPSSSYAESQPKLLAKAPTVSLVKEEKEKPVVPTMTKKEWEKFRKVASRSISPTTGRWKVIYDY